MKEHFSLVIILGVLGLLIAGFGLYSTMSEIQNHCKINTPCSYFPSGFYIMFISFIPLGITAYLINIEYGYDVKMSSTKQKLNGDTRK